jgi:hypothetical protein
MLILKSRPLYTREHMSTGQWDFVSHLAQIAQETS